MKKKTLKEWNKSNLDLAEYLGNTPCEIDQHLDYYIGECTAPKYLSYRFTQGGNAEDHESESDVGYYHTTSRFNNKYYYLGVLPEFKQ